MKGPANNAEARPQKLGQMTYIHARRSGAQSANEALPDGRLRRGNHRSLGVDWSDDSTWVVVEYDERFGLDFESIRR